MVRLVKEFITRWSWEWRNTSCRASVLRWLVNVEPAACILEMSNKLRLAIHTCTRFLGSPPNIFYCDDSRPGKALILWCIMSGALTKIREYEKWQIVDQIAGHWLGRLALSLWSGFYWHNFRYDPDQLYLFSRKQETVCFCCQVQNFT